MEFIFHYMSTRLKKDRNFSENDGEFPYYMLYYEQKSHLHYRFFYELMIGGWTADGERYICRRIVQ